MVKYKYVKEYKTGDTMTIFWYSLKNLNPIAKIQVTTTTSSIISISPTPTFLVHVLPFKWLNRELKGMLHNLFACFNVFLPHFIASIASSCASYVHCLFTLIVGILVALVGLRMGFNLGGMFSWLVLGCWSIVTPLHLLQNTCNIMDSPFLLA